MGAHAEEREKQMVLAERRVHVAAETFSRSGAGGERVHVEGNKV